MLLFILNIIISLIIVMMGIGYLFFPKKVSEFQERMSGKGGQRIKNMRKKKWYWLNLRICGAVLILMACLFLSFFIANFIKNK